MSTEQLTSINDLVKFVDDSQKVAFAVLGNKREKYKWIQTNLLKFNYFNLNKNNKGIFVQYLQKITGYSR